MSAVRRSPAPPAWPAGATFIGAHRRDAMTARDLPAWATAQEAAEWLRAETSEPWPLTRLVETGAMPHVWLAPEGVSPAVFAAVFDGRHEGLLAPLVFAVDTHRISIVRTGGISMTVTTAAATAWQSPRRRLFTAALPTPASQAPRSEPVARATASPPVVPIEYHGEGPPRARGWANVREPGRCAGFVVSRTKTPRRPYTSPYTDPRNNKAQPGGLG